jgi:hypothetical protein
MQPVSAPVIIFAFSRPEYLRRLCASLKAQQGVVLRDEQVHLLQDGATSLKSGVTYGDPKLLQECVEAFYEYFPNGKVHAAPHNLGIAMNILRGEKLVFETLDEEVGYFFEEDLELGPCYLAMLERMRAMLRDHPSVGYFAAYGNHRVESDPEAPKIVPLEHHWGFALTRRCWRALLPWLQPFYDIWSEIDYQSRPHLRIVEVYAQKKVASTQSSQDVAKTMGCAELGFARINTDVCYARYIGEKGQSFTAATFARLGYEKMHYATAMPAKGPVLTAEQVAEIAERKRAHHTMLREKTYEAELEKMRQRLYNPDKPATREEIDWLWRLLMDRVPEGEHYYEKNVGISTVRQIRAGLLKSREARAKSFLKP